MLKFIDNFLDRITMYRTVLYILLGLLGIATILAFAGVLHYSPWGIMYSSLVLVIGSVIFNKILGWFFKVPVNIESAYITALILALIITPPAAGQFITIIPILALAGATAIASKYVVSLGKKHLFNPAAFAVVLTSLIVGQSASWWIGTAVMLPFTLIFGLMMTRKLRQFHLLWAFLGASILGTIALTFGHGGITNSVWKAIEASPLIFFGTIMLTEPLTMPPTKWKRVLYGALAGLLIIPQAKFGPWSITPEIALIIANIFSYVISPKGRHVFTLQKIQKAGDAAFDFIFKTDKQFAFAPGQYMEWTLGHKSADSRGNRRYFTIASSPTESETILGVKFYPQPSTYKKAMRGMHAGETIIGAQLAGDFTLPKELDKKLVFIAGGIGVTPFRSMTKYMIDSGEHRDVVLLYSNRSKQEIAYAEIFEEAHQKFGMRSAYTITDVAPVDWTGYKGFIDAKMISTEVPDFNERLFYISGSHVFVTAMKKTLLDMGVGRGQIKTDFFPGLA